MFYEEDWRIPPFDLELCADDVHVWGASLEDITVHFKRLERVLSDDETQRARRFYFERDRVRFIIARGVLRYILSRYRDKEPDEHHFDYNRYGKPTLSGENLLRFNVSHSGGRVLYAITSGWEIGIDIEHVRPFENAEQIVERFFSEREKTEFRTLPEYLKSEAFFTCWTRKEAYMKARGKGMSLPIDQFSVSFLPGEPARLVYTQCDKKEKNRWSIKEIKVNAEYVAAAAVEGHGLYFHHWKWSW